MRLLLASLSAAVLCAGCTFSREIVNPHVRELDTSWIEPGKTTRQEIVDRMGFPPTVRGFFGVQKDSFRWVSTDTFTGRFELGYIVTPTFERGAEHNAEDILVKFDDHGVVTLVSRTRSDGESLSLVDWRESAR